MRPSLEVERYERAFELWFVDCNHVETKLGTIDLIETTIDSDYPELRWIERTSSRSEVNRYANTGEVIEHLEQLAKALNADLVMHDPKQFNVMTDPRLTKVGNTTYIE